MTVAMLFALYRAACAEAVRATGGWPDRGPDLEVVDAALTPLERAIVELALHDVTNGTPVRSRAAFDRAVAVGAALLRALGLRDEGGAPVVAVEALADAA